MAEAMTDALLAQLRQLLANVATAGGVRPRLVLYQLGGEIYVYLQSDANAPGETWMTDVFPVPTAEAWPSVLDRVADVFQLGLLVEANAAPESKMTGKEFLAWADKNVEPRTEEELVDWIADIESR